MAGVSVDSGGHGGKKAVDSEIPLIPFIDLLLCCVMFLLLTAVWQQTARIDTNQKMPGTPQTEDEPIEEDEKVKLMLQVKADRSYAFTTSAGDRVAIDKLNEEQYDNVQLQEKLANFKTQFGLDHKEIIVAPEDGVEHAAFIEALDLAVGAGFPSVSVSDGATL